MNIRKIFSLNIKYLRKKKGLSQKELAKELNCTNTTISNWEVGIRVPESIDLPMIAEYFGVSIDDLLTKDLMNEEIHSNKKDKVILDNIKLLTDEEKEKILSIIDLIKK